MTADLRKLASLCRAEFRERHTDMRDALAVRPAIWRVISNEFPHATDGERGQIEEAVREEMSGKAKAA